MKSQWRWSRRASQSQDGRRKQGRVQARSRRLCLHTLTRRVDDGLDISEFNPRYSDTITRNTARKERNSNNYNQIAFLLYTALHNWFSKRIAENFPLVFFDNDGRLTRKYHPAPTAQDNRMVQQQPQEDDDQPDTLDMGNQDTRSRETAEQWEPLSTWTTRELHVLPDH